MGRGVGAEVHGWFLVLQLHVQLHVKVLNVHGTNVHCVGWTQ